MASIFSKLFTKKTTEGAPAVPPAKGPAAPPPGTPLQKLPPGGPQLKTPLPPGGPRPPGAGGAGTPGGIKLPKKRITQRITVDPSKAGAAGAAGTVAPQPGLRPAGAIPAQSVPTMKLTIPGPKAGAQAAQQTQKVDTKSIAMPLLVPVHVILNALPRDLLTCDVASVSKAPEGQREVALPLSTILAMLPSGRIELPARDLVKLLPEGWALPVDQVPDAYPISLPLAAIVPRIPPEMLAIRPDQKDIDPAVRQMNDPFTQEMIDKLAAQAAAAGEPAPTEEPGAGPEPEPAPVPEGEAAEEASAPELEPEPPGVEAEVAMAEEPPKASEPDFAESLRLLAEQAEASLSEEQSSSTPSSEGEPASAPTEEEVESTADEETQAEATAVSALEMGVKTIDQPLTQAIPVVEAEEATEPELSSFSFDEPAEKAESEAKATEPQEEEVVPREESVEATGAGFDASQFALPQEIEADEAERAESETGADAVEETAEVEVEEEGKQGAEPEPETVAPEATKVEDTPAPQVEAASVSEPEPTKPAEPVSFAPPPPPAPPAPVKFQVPPPPPKIPPAITATPPPPPGLSVPSPLTQTSSIKIPVTGELGNAAQEIRIHLNQCGVDDLTKIPGVSARLARKVLAWRELHGDFTEFSQLLSIPGMTKEIYRQFTGDPDSETALSGQVNVLLGAPLTERLSLRDVAHHIRRWPSIQGCIIAGAEGLPIAKDVTDGDLAESLSAFLPRIMNHVNETMEQIKAMPADEVHIVSEELGYFIYRRGGLYVVMLSSEKDLPEYYGKVVRALLQELTEGKKTRVEL